MSLTLDNTDNWPAIRDQARERLGEDIGDFIAAVRAGDHPDSQLISVLHRVQDKFGYLSPENLDAVAQLMQIPAAKVSGVATFYHYFRLQPCGRFIIRVCMGTACYVKGADRVSEKLQEELGITFGETTRDGLFSLEDSRCLGTCGLAPVVMIGDDVHGQMTADKVPALIGAYIEKAGRDQG